jgi:hypothetical protein
MKYLVISLALFGVGRIGQLGYFKYNEYHSTQCKEAGWSFIKERLNVSTDDKLRMNLQASIAGRCYSKYGRTY